MNVASLLAGEAGAANTPTATNTQCFAPLSLPNAPAVAYSSVQLIWRSVSICVFLMWVINVTPFL